MSSVSLLTLAGTRYMKHSANYANENLPGAFSFTEHK